VLSYAIIADYFPVEIAARANGALNLAHFGWAFVVQYGIGLIVGHWATEGGHYPVVAYQIAFGLSIVLQAIALIWFAVPWLRGLSKQLSSAFARPDAGPELVLAPAEGSILEGSQGSDW
jgi:MFS family permease